MIKTRKRRIGCGGPRFIDIAESGVVHFVCVCVLSVAARHSMTLVPLLSFELLLVSAIVANGFYGRNGVGVDFLLFGWKLGIGRKNATNTGQRSCCFLHGSAGMMRLKDGLGHWSLKNAIPQTGRGCCLFKKKHDQLLPGVSQWSHQFS